MEKYGFRSCCGFPHGITSIYALILGISSSLIILSSAWGCKLVQVDFIFLNNSPEEVEDQGSMTMGLLSYQDRNPGSNLQCISYSEEHVEEFDAFFRAGRACALLANIMIGFSVLLLLCMSCIAVRYYVVTILSGFLLFGGVFQGMTLLVYFSSFSCDACRFDFGSALALMGTVVAMATGAVVCHIPEAVTYEEYEDEDDFSDVKHIGRPPTPRFLTHGVSGLNPSASTSSSEGYEEEGEEESQEIVIPKTWRVKDAEVVLVLPDGSKQVIEPIAGPKQTYCETACSFFPETNCK